MKLCVGGIEFRVFKNEEVGCLSAVIIDSRRHDEDKLYDTIIKIERDFPINIIF